MTDSTIQNFRFFSDSLDILIVAIIFFYILKAIEGTRSSQILIGIVAMVILYFTSRKWGFFTLNWVLTHFLGFAILIVIILFQDDIRRGLANIGKKPFLFSFAKHSANETVIEELVAACSFLSSRKIGALIAIERQESLKMFPGRPINATLSSEMIISIFNTASPLHDGGLVIKDEVILSAGCFFPISTDLELGTELGTRHRAAIELSRETDAIVVIVSEETGKISLAADGELKRIANAKLLRPSLVSVLSMESPGSIKASQAGKA